MNSSELLLITGRKTFRKTRSQESKVNDEIMLKIKEIIVGIRLAGATISRKMVIAIGTGVIKANNPSLLLEFGESVRLSENWTRGVLKNMNWVKRKGTAGKVEPSKQLLGKTYISEKNLQSCLRASYTIRVDHQR